MRSIGLRISPVSIGCPAVQSERKVVTIAHSHLVVNDQATWSSCDHQRQSRAFGRRTRIPWDDNALLRLVRSIVPNTAQSCTISHNQGAGASGLCCSAPAGNCNAQWRPNSDMRQWAFANTETPASVMSDTGCALSATGMVPRKGLEPSHLSAHGPEPCASTNSATWATATNNFTFRV